MLDVKATKRFSNGAKIPPGMALRNIRITFLKRVLVVQTISVMDTYVHQDTEEDLQMCIF